MEQTRQRFEGVAGYSAMILATVAIFAVIFQLAVGPFAPQPSVEEGVAGLVVELKDALTLSVSERPTPELQSTPWDIDRTLTAVSIGVAGLAMLIAIVAFMRREPKWPAIVGFGLGAGTLLLIWLQWIAMLLIGALIISAIIGMIGEGASL